MNLCSFLMLMGYSKFFLSIKLRVSSDVGKPCVCFSGLKWFKFNNNYDVINAFVAKLGWVLEFKKEKQLLFQTERCHREKPN